LKIGGFTSKLFSILERERQQQNRREGKKVVAFGNRNEAGSKKNTPPQGLTFLIAGG
jgi:hypothetical protein